MSLKLVTAIIREDFVESVSRALEAEKIPGLTASPVNGYGEYAKFFSSNNTETWARIEIYLDEARAQMVAELIMDKASTGLTGDGIVAILPVDYMFRIRDKCEIVGR